MSRSDALRAQAAAWRAVADALDAEAAALDAETTATPPAPYVAIGEYAERVRMSKRTIRNFLDAGMPSVGSGRGRRIEVEVADRWLAEHRDRVEDGVEKQARAAARAAASSMTTTRDRDDDHQQAG